jgi:hypothetical protein
VTAVLATVAGVALAGIVLRDAFDALFHVEGQGTLSRVLTRLMWRTVGRTGRAHRLLPLAGGARPERPDIVRLRAGLLLAALRDFAVTTANRFHRAEASGTEDLLRAYARDHFTGER